MDNETHFQIKKNGSSLLLNFLLPKIDLAFSTECKSRLIDIVNEGYDRVILNLSKVASVDSAGLGMLLTIQKMFESQGKGKLVLCCLNPPVDAMLRLTNAHQFFAIYAEEKEALSGAQGRVKQGSGQHNARLDSSGGPSSSANPPPAAAPLQNAALDLIKKYRDSIPEKIENINSLFQIVKENPTKENITNLKGAIHKISGSAGSYGYKKASEASLMLELFLTSALKQSSLEKDFLNKLQSLLDNIKVNLLKNPQEESGGVVSHLSAPIQPYCFVATGDSIALSVFQQAGKNTGCLVVQESDPKKVLDRLKATSSMPEAIFIDQKFPQSPQEGLDLIKMIKQEQDCANVKLGLLVDEDSLSLNVAASKENVSYIMRKPLALKSIEPLLRPKSKAASISPDLKVLAIDDDRDVLNMIEGSLKELNISVEVHEDETRILDYLQEYDPDLLLLDIHMPNFDGWSLLKTLRSDLRYKDLKVVVVTAAENADSLKEAHQECDDVWAKPLDRTVIQRKIRRDADSLNREHSEADHLFSTFLNPDEFKVFFKKLMKANPEGRTYYLAVIGSKHASAFNRLPKAEREDYLISCENLFNQLIANDLVRGYFNQGRFVFIFSGVEKEQMEAKIEQFLKESEDKVFLTTPEGVFSSFSASLAAFKPPEDDIDGAIASILSSFGKAERGIEAAGAQN